jgi:hypothetical protein
MSNVHWCAGFEGYDLKPVVEPFKVCRNRAGFTQVTNIIDGLLDSGLYDRVVLGHEPTGAWSRALYDRYQAHRCGQAQPQLDYQFLNPLPRQTQRQRTSSNLSLNSKILPCLSSFPGQLVAKKPG